MKKLLLSLISIFIFNILSYGITISGYTISTSSTPINNVYVLLTGSYSYSQSVYTTVVGSYNFTLYPGTYTIFTTRSGYAFSPMYYSLSVSTFATSNLYKNFFGRATGGAEFYKVVLDTPSSTANMYLKGNINVGFSTGTPNIVIDSSGVVHFADGTSMYSTSTLTAPIDPAFVAKIAEDTTTLRMDLSAVALSTKTFTTVATDTTTIAQNVAAVALSTQTFTTVATDTTTLQSNKVSKAGDTMSGDLNMSNSDIVMNGFNPSGGGIRMLAGVGPCYYQLGRVVNEGTLGVAHLANQWT